MNARLRQIQNFFGRPWHEQTLLIQTVALLGMFRLAIKLLTFSRLERFLGERLTESPADASPHALERAQAIAKAIHRVSPHTPWESNCFPQALTAKVLLRRHGIGSTLYLGARFADSKTELMAHAWLRCGPLYLTGGDGSEQFGAIAAFS